MRVSRTLLVLGLSLTSLLLGPVPPPAFAAGGQLDVLGRDGSVVLRITDGDTLRLRLTLPQAPSASLTVDFGLEAGQPVAACTVEAGQTTCETLPLLSLGWFWDEAARSAPSRTIVARPAGSLDLLAQASLEVAPRPVVMVHGFASSAEAWVNYLGPTGYLARHGIPGFAVGDGQVPGTMNTGNLAQPTQRTNTLLENAAILGDYIAGVKQRTGAQMVDLVGHSMGGLISRAYIDRVMGGRDVAQLIMLGSPMAGTGCANLPAALGLYLPATLEIRPSYVRQIFNPQVRQRHGIAFHALAGVPIVEGFKSPCTDVPSDLAVSLSSVTAVPVQVGELPVLHTDLNLSAQVFDEFVLPLLQLPAGGFPERADPPASAPEAESAQFSGLFRGHVDAGSSTELTIPIDAGIRVASFALYDTTRTLQVSVTGASGKTIELSPEKNGLVVVDDPQALFYLGYGFKDPKPGLWRVRLASSSATPAQGADFSLTARFVGGAELLTQVTPLLPLAGEPVRLEAFLRLGGEDLPLREASASLRRPDGTAVAVALSVDGTRAEAEIHADREGLYGLDVVATGMASDGTPIERSAFLAFEVQPNADRRLPPIAWMGAVLGGGALAVLVTALLRRRRNRRALRPGEMPRA